jgi:hypothetical protein
MSTVALRLKKELSVAEGCCGGTGRQAGQRKGRLTCWQEEAAGSVAQTALLPLQLHACNNSCSPATWLHMPMLHHKEMLRQQAHRGFSLQ